jgi:hypothetical protein
MKESKVTRILNEPTKKAVIGIPKTIDKHIQNYQYASKRRYNNSKPTKTDLVVRMACIGLDAFIKEYQEMKRETKEFNSPK